MAPAGSGRLFGAVIGAQIGSYVNDAFNRARAARNIDDDEAIS
jgi:hypothetical protein